MSEVLVNMINRCKITGVQCKQVSETTCIIGEYGAMYGCREINGKLVKSESFRLISTMKTLIRGQEPLLCCLHRTGLGSGLSFINDNMESSSVYDSLMCVSREAIIVGQRIEATYKRNKLHGIIDINENMVAPFTRGYPFTYIFGSEDKESKRVTEECWTLNRELFEMKYDAGTIVKRLGLPLIREHQIKLMREAVDYTASKRYYIIPFGSTAYGYDEGIVPAGAKTVSIRFVMIVGVTDNKLYGPYEFVKDSLVDVRNILYM